MTKLTDIPGIGPALAARLEAVGIADPAALIGADMDMLTGIPGVTATRVAVWKAAATGGPATVPTRRPRKVAADRAVSPASPEPEDAAPVDAATPRDGELSAPAAIPVLAEVAGADNAAATAPSKKKAAKAKADKKKSDKKKADKAKAAKKAAGKKTADKKAADKKAAAKKKAGKKKADKKAAAKKTSKRKK